MRNGATSTASLLPVRIRSDTARPVAGGRAPSAELVHEMRENYAAWFMLLYLVMADIVNTALSAFLAFCENELHCLYCST